MRIAILRRALQESISMDVYADALIRGLRAIRPNWKIVELAPAITKAADSCQPKWLVGMQKYYQRYWRYPLRLQLEEVDLFHIIDHSDGYLSYWLKSCHKPNVVTCHDLINLIQPETFKGRACFPLISMTAWQLGIRGMKSANHIISVSSHTKKDMIRYLQIQPQKVTVVHNAVDAKFRPLSQKIIHSFRQQQGTTSKQFCLLNVGSNNARKNISTILKVVAVLSREGFPIHFWKVGADFNDEQEYFIQKHNLCDCVSYLGKPDENLLVTIYNAADSLIAPSLYEGFGLTVLEAMACGTPVIAANTTALPEIAGDAAILVEPTNISAIAVAVRKLYHNPAYRLELVKKGLTQVKSFTWENTAEQVARVYENVFSDLTK